MASMPIKPAVKVNWQRIKKLSKPNDKRKVAKQLMVLRQMFPHDRVLERMVQDELGKTQAFKYPQEYDVYNPEKDEKLRLFEIPANERGLIKKDDTEYGSVKLEGFKANDKTVFAMKQRQIAVLAKAKVAFEKQLILDA
jgi:hypothetical protein